MVTTYKKKKPQQYFPLPQKKSKTTAKMPFSPPAPPSKKKSDCINFLDSLVNKNQIPVSKKTQTVYEITHAHKKYMLRNPSKINLVKQSILLDCLCTAKAIGEHLTAMKLAEASASQLATIRKESIQSAQALNGQQPLDSNKQTINIMQILNEQNVINPARAEIDNFHETENTLNIEGKVIQNTDK